MIEGLHVVRKTRHGRMPLWYVYAYRGGPQIHRHEGPARPRLTDAAVRKLIAATEAKITRVSALETLSSLCKSWRPNSAEWQRLSATTQKTWASALDAIEAKWGSTPLTVWNDPRMTAKVVEWRDSRADKPRAADIGVSVLKALLKFGYLRGRVQRNAAEGIPQLYRSGNRSEIIWTDEDMAAFAEASRKLDMQHVNDGLRLAALTGLRRADLVSLNWDEVANDALIKRAAKVSRGKRRTVVMPRFPALDELLEELRSRERKEGVQTVLVNSFGASWTGDGFGGSFNRVRDEARIIHRDADTGIERKKHLHDVRGTFCTKLITVGDLTNEQAAEFMGWSPEQVAGIRRTYVDQTAVNMALAARLRSSL